MRYCPGRWSSAVHWQPSGVMHMPELFPPVCSHRLFENDRLYKEVMWLFWKRKFWLPTSSSHVTEQKGKFVMAYISVSKMVLKGSFLKKKFLFRKCLMDYQKRKIWWLTSATQKSFWREYCQKKNLTADISSSKMVLAKITKKRNFPFRKLYARNVGKMPEKS